MLPLALAATLLLGIGGATVWTPSRPSADLVRGDLDGFALVKPGQDATVGRGSRFVRHSLPGAAFYRLELVDAEGNLAFSAETADTGVALPDSLTLGSGRYQAWVEAALGDGTRQRTRATRLRVP